MSSTGGFRGGRLRRWRLRDVVLFSLLPFVAAMYLLAASVGDYWRLTQFDDWWSRVARIDHFAWWRVRAALELPRAMKLDEKLSAEDTQRALVDLRVDRNEFDAIAADPTAHVGESVKAYLGDGDSREEVELKLRGDTSVHWTGEKKTLAIKSARGKAFHDNLVTVFSCKEVLAQFAANSMAADFGLLAPPTAVVPVFMNLRFNGMFRTFAPLDEMFLRNRGRAPGNIFRGDTAERGDYFKGVPRELFVNPYIWDRVAQDDQPGAVGMSKLFEFVARVNRAESDELSMISGDDDSVSKLFEILDRDEIARLLALDLCVGDPWHSSGVHNHFWYEDRASGILHPIPWDLRMLDLEHPPQNAQYNRFWRAALRDPRVFAKTLEVIHARNQDGKLLADVAHRVNETWQRYRDGFAFDQLRCGPAGTAPNAEVGTPEEVLGTLRRNLATLETWCNEARVSASIVSSDQDVLVLDLLVDGRAPIRWVLADTCPEDGLCTLDADADLNGTLGPGDRRVAEWNGGQEDWLPQASEDVFPGLRVGKRLEPAPLAYRYFLRARGHHAENIKLRFTNAVTGTEVAAVKLEPGSLLPASNSAHPWTFREPALREVTLEGDVRLGKTLEIPVNTTLKIAPGTKIVLEPEVSIQVKGCVQAWGSEAAPITITGANPRRPWGSLALSGAGASRSSFTHVAFSGGGGASLDGVECTGMVCVHGARDVLFRDCEFSANQRCDDALHAEMSEVALGNCWFHDTNADALDLDASTSTIEHCKIERAGRDGIAMLAGSARIIGNALLDERGAGISAGQSANPLVFSNTISGCKRGIEAGDRSAPLILNNTISKNQVGVMVRMHSGRGERGGWPRMVRTLLAGNASDLTLDKNTLLTEGDCRVGQDDESAGEAQALDFTWLYALHGIGLEPDTFGAAPTWRATPPARVIDEERFPAGWIAPEATWHRAGGVTSSRIDEDCLVVRTNAEPGQIARDVAWDLGDPARTNWLVLELSSTAIRSARVRIERAGGARGESAIEAVLSLSGDTTHFDYTIVPLPPGKYTELSLILEPRSASGRVLLNGWSVISALTADSSPSK